MIKRIFLLIILFSSAILLSQENSDPQNQKSWYVSLSKSRSEVNPYEKRLYLDIFGPYKPDLRNNLNHVEFNLSKKFNSSNLGFYFEFYEATKRNYSLYYVTFSGRTIVNEELKPIGDYFRTQSRIGLNYFFTQRIYFHVGSRYFKSQLSDGFANSFQIDFGQKYIGAEAGINIKSSRFYGLYLEARITGFYLYGRSTQDYSFRTLSADFGVISVDINPITRVTGLEILTKLGFYFNDSIFMSLGYRSTNQKIRPDDLRVYSGDQSFDNELNFRYGQRGLNSYNDIFTSILFEVGTEI